MRLIALVKFNSGVALVLTESPKYTYTKHGSIIIGIDKTGTFVKCYEYRRPCGSFKAFAGNEFDIPLDTGEIIHCDGQWWHGGHSEAGKILGKDLVNATYNDVESLKRCYVYTGDSAIKEKWQELVDGYDGKLYEYREYEAAIKKAKGA